MTQTCNETQGQPTVRWDQRGGAQLHPPKVVPSSLCDAPQWSPTKMLLLLHNGARARLPAALTCERGFWPTLLHNSIWVFCPFPTSTDTTLICCNRHLPPGPLPGSLHTQQQEYLVTLLYVACPAREPSATARCTHRNPGSSEQYLAFLCPPVRALGQRTL